MKKYFTSVVFAVSLFAFSGELFAQDYTYLTFKKSSAFQGYESSLPVEGLKIVFSDGNMVATSPSGNQTIPLSSLSEMFFSEQTTGVSGATSDLPVVSFSGSVLRISAPEGSQVKIFNSGGQTIAISKVNGASASFNISSLAKGVYFVKVNERVTKISKR